MDVDDEGKYTPNLFCLFSCKKTSQDTIVEDILFLVARPKAAHVAPVVAQAHRAGCATIFASQP